MDMDGKTYLILMQNLRLLIHKKFQSKIYENTKNKLNDLVLC